MIATIKFYLRLLIRRSPIMIILIVLFSAAGVTAALRLPASYQAAARLIVETPQIPDELATSTVRISATEEIEFIRQRLLTRDNLLEIQRKFNVLGDTSQMAPDEIVGAMRLGTSIRNFQSGGRRGEGPTLLTVAFTAERGDVAANVVNEFVTRIINENVTLRTETAEDTLSFFQQEVDRLSEELNSASLAISDFQRENSDALPSNLPYRQGRLTLLQERITSAEREIAALLEQRERIQTAFERTGGGLTNLNRPVPPSADEQQLATLRTRLRQALTIYSETNPNVTNLRNQIEILEMQIEQAKSAPVPEDNTAQIVLELQFSEIDSRLESLSDEITSTEDIITDLAQSVARTPNVGVTLDQLQRDYENVRSQYDRAVRSLSSATMGERIELTSRGQRITLIEAATVPNEPNSPNRPRIAMMGFGVGLGLAGAFFALLEFLNRSIRRPAELKSRLGITPIVTIPYIETARRKVFRRIVKIILIFGAIAVTAGGLYVVDEYYRPLELIVQQLLRAAGL